MIKKRYPDLKIALRENKIPNKRIAYDLGIHRTAVSQVLNGWTYDVHGVVDKCLVLLEEAAEEKQRKQKQRDRRLKRLLAKVA